MPPRKRAAATPGITAVESIRHDDSRANIPTGELSAFVGDEERNPADVVLPRRSAQLYPRDPAADPQLVWRGKDEQDEQDLHIPAVPIYIQEKIEPRALVENLRDTAAAGRPEPELTLFDDFDGLLFDDLVDFYEHDANWSNRLILGESLQIMASLADKENLRGKVQMIYIDPPYGIKFNSNWQVSTRRREVQDNKETDLTRQPEQIRAFRDTWRGGIHSFLGYLRDRLEASRDLLAESGSVFVQIGDENVHLVRTLLDEVFGTENFVAQIAYTKTSGATADLLSGVNDYILWYAKSRAAVKYRPLFTEKALGGDGARKYDQVLLPDGTRRPLLPAERRGDVPPAGRVYRHDNLTSQSMGRDKGEGAASWFDVTVDGATINPGERSRWKTNKAGMDRLLLADRVALTGRSLAYIRFLGDFPAFSLTSSWSDIGGIQSRRDPKVYVVQTSTTAVMRCLLMSTDPGDLVLDPTCGSGTTAVVAEQHGRRWITCDTSRVALTLARTRLMAALFPSYLLADSPEGAAKEAELSKAPPQTPGTFTNDVRKGFVYKRVPHITLKSIAQNPDIKPGMSADDIQDLVEARADFEVLYDQPFEGPKRVRVCGRFTVESLAPHRVVDPEQEQSDSEAAGVRADEKGYEETILDNLREAGVQNTVKGERLEFESLERLPGGLWVQARGSYTTVDGYVRTVAVHIGPQYGTVGSDHVAEAAKEALRGTGVDLLLVLGFAFDAHAGEKVQEIVPEVGKGLEAAFEVRLAERRMGRLPVLMARMNPDLAMATELKTTRTGNLFMVFGEPDITINATDTDQVHVELHGLDVYDPTTGAIRAHSTDDIACWFLDTNYNGESFFVRHAYFTGGTEPYQQLARALQAEINSAAWKSLYSTVSRPFAKPSTGRVAVKVINHYGDEVLKVYDIK
jgi:Adenine specific DNA methylase Mod